MDDDELKKLNIHERLAYFKRVKAALNERINLLLVLLQQETERRNAEREQQEARHLDDIGILAERQLKELEQLVALHRQQLSDVAVRVGQYVKPGTQILAVVPVQDVYVVANFKETQLTHVRAGQPVEVEIDGFPGKKLEGRVDSLAPASGLEFALLPPDNATGNFTKIVQRIPVKIVVDKSDLAGLLRPGMSVEPTIDTTSAAKAG